MFDWMILPFKCPFCKFEQVKPSQHEEGIWQTKATKCLLNVYKKGSKLQFDEVTVKDGEIGIHNICPRCDKYISANAQIKDGRLTGRIAYSKKERL